MNEKECLKYVEEGYNKGVKRVLDFLKKEKIICDKEDNCSECNKIRKLLNEEYNFVNHKKVGTT